MSDKVTSQAYNSVWQLRVDTWSSITDVTKRLSDATLPQDQRRFAWPVERKIRQA